VLRYNAEGIDGLHDRLRSGRPSFLDEGQMAVFRGIVLRDPDTEREGISSWTAKDLCRVVEARLGITYRESGMLKLLHSLGLSWQKTPSLPSKSGSQCSGRFKRNFNHLIQEIAASRPEAERLEIWFQDEARIGQTGRTSRRWFEKGVRPRG